MFLFAMQDPLVQWLGKWLEELSVWTILIRLCLAIIFGIVLGIERATKRHSAGVRSFLLVCFAGALAAMLDLYFSRNLGYVLPILSAALALSIAIISANTMVYSSRNKIKGLTTSIALWSTCFIGVALGIGLYVLSIIATVVLYVALHLIIKFERYLKNRGDHFEIHLELKNKADLQKFMITVRKLGIKIDDIESNPAYVNSGLSVYTMSLTINSKELKKYKTHAEIIEALSSVDYINIIEEI